MNMSMRLRSISSGVVLAAAAVIACSDDTSSNPQASRDDAGSSDGSSGSDGGNGDSGGDSGKVDADPSSALNGCTTFADRTADGARRVIQWNTSLFQREERCMLIKKGQKIVFSEDANGSAPADFTAHPLSAEGGDSPNPVDTALDKDTGEVTFPTAGEFGYICDVHAVMIGAIKVTE